MPVMGWAWGSENCQLLVFQDRIEFRKFGWIHKDFKVLRMSDIRSTSLHKGVVAATLVVTGGGGTTIVVNGVPNDGSADLVALIENVRSAAQDDEPPTSSESLPQLIQELADLRDTGALTEEEFQAKKSELLARL
jgi:hypothetical protein